MAEAQMTHIRSRLEVTLLTKKITRYVSWTSQDRLRLEKEGEGKRQIENETVRSPTNPETSLTVGSTNTHTD